MEVQEPQKSRVVVIDSSQSWELYVAQATNQNRPVVVHFTASWCMPSVAMNTFFEELASSYQDALFLTVDVDEVKDVATKLEIKAMPTFVLLKDRTVVDKIIGANPEEIKKRIDGFVQSIRVSVAYFISNCYMREKKALLEAGDNRVALSMVATRVAILHFMADFEEKYGAILPSYMVPPRDPLWCSHHQEWHLARLQNVSLELQGPETFRKTQEI